MTEATAVQVAGRKLRLTSLDKLLYPSTETTKGEVLSYYAQVADVMLPHLAHRPRDPGPLAARRGRPELLREEPAVAGRPRGCPGCGSTTSPTRWWTTSPR